MELSELMWNDNMPISKKHQALVLNRVEKAKENPDKLSNLDTVFKTPETPNAKKKLSAKKFSGVLKAKEDALVIQKRLRGEWK